MILRPLLLAATLFAPPTLAQGDPCHGDSPVAQTVEDIQSALDAGQSDRVVVDTSSLFREGVDVDALARVLRTVADEPGEKGYVALNVTAGGQVGTGVVTGALEGEVDLEVSYLVTDENRAVLGMDLEAAIKAGISLAGLVEVGGKFEAGGSLVKLSFPDSYSAAAWLAGQLDRMNARTDYRLWPRSSQEVDGRASDPVALTDRWVAGGVYGEAGVGRVSASAEGQARREYRRFHGVIDGQAVDITQITDHLVGSATVQVDWRGAPVEVRYTYDRYNVSNSPYYYNNGPGLQHLVDIRIPIVHGQRSSTVEGAPTEGAQDLLARVFAAVERYAPGSTLKGVNYRVFEALVEQAYKNAASTSKVGATTYLTLTLDMNYYGEADGSYNLLYQRLLLGGEQQLGAEFNVKAVKVGLEVSAGLVENVYERLGTETISYFQRQFVYQTADRPWSAFKEQNGSALDQLVQNIADPDHPYHLEAVADAFDRGGYEAGLRVLEQHWAQENDQVAALRQDAAELARLSNKWRWANRDDTLRRDMADVFWKYRGNEQMRQYLFNLVDDFGGRPQMIKDLSDGSGSQAWRLWIMTRNFEVGE